MRRQLIVALTMIAALCVSCGGGSGDTQPTATVTSPTATPESVSLPLRPDQQAVYVVDADGSNLRKLFDQGDYLDALPDPAGGRVAVTASNDGGQQGTAYVVDLASGDREEIASIRGSLRIVGWSPDGQSLVLVSYPLADVPGAERELLMYRPSARALDRLPLSASFVSAWDADGAGLYVAEGYSPSTLARVDLSSGATQPIPGVEFDSIALSPDGQWFAIGTYVRSPGNQVGIGSAYRIDVLRTDGSERQELVALGDETFVARISGWSPDGSRIAYSWVTTREGPGGLPSGVYVADVATGDVTRLTDAPEGIDSHAEWSPDGDALLVNRHVCTNCDGPGSKVVLARADGSGELALPGTEAFRYTDAAWAPDGARFAYGADVLYTANADGADVRTIVALPTSAYSSLAWTDDGARLFFVRTPALEATLYAVQPDGGGLAALTNTSSHVLAVAPDGRTTLELGTENALSIAVLGGERVELRHEALALISSGPSQFAWSADSSRVAFSLQGGEGALVIAGIDGAVRALEAEGKSSSGRRRRWRRPRARRGRRPAGAARLVARRRRDRLRRGRRCPGRLARRRWRSPNHLPGRPRHERRAGAPLVTRRRAHRRRWLQQADGRFTRWQ
jgi:Tol biopolymer transport system component